MSMDDRRVRDRHTPERRHNTRGKMTALGCALGMVLLLVTLFLLWPLVYA